MIKPAQLQKLVEAAKNGGASGLVIDGEKLFIEINGQSSQTRGFNVDDYRELEAASLRRRKAPAKRKG